MHSPTPISAPSTWGEQKVNTAYTPLSSGDKPVLSYSKSIISARLSGKHFRSISSGDGSTASYTVKGTTSFTAIHKDVSLSTSSSLSIYTTTPSNQGGSRRGDNPGGNAAGDESVPVGDMLLPALAMAVAYIIIRLFHNRKTSQAL